MVSFKLGILFTKHDAIEIADPNHEYAGRVSYIDYVISHAHHRVSVTQWWNIGRSEVRFLVGTQNFFFVPHS